MQSDNSLLNTKHNYGNRLISGVMVLTVSTLLCKIIGLLYKIPIINIVGIEGMANFSSAYNVYMLLNSIAAAGLPVAVSIMVSKNLAEGNFSNVRKIFGTSLILFLILGISGTLILYFSADVYAEAIGISSSAPSVRAIAPTLLFICVSGAIRGYFQGYEIMMPTAVSQLIESIGKLTLGIGLAAYCVNMSMDSSYTSAAAVIGLSAGVFISVIYLVVYFLVFSVKKKKIYKTDRFGITDSNKKILRDLLVIALPITLSSCVTSITGIADTALITNRLVESGFSTDAAVSLYSSYTNLSIPLYNLPPALITSIGISLIPALSGAVSRGDDNAAKKSFLLSIRLCCMMAIPAAAGMAVFAKPILMLLYSSQHEACAFAAPLLSILSAAIVFSCLITVCNATLQAYLKPTLPIVSMAIGAIVKIVLEYFLVGGNLGIYGAPLSTVGCTLTILILDLFFITIYTPQRFSFTAVAKTLAATIVAIGLSAVLYYFLMLRQFGSIVSLAASIMVAIILYSLFVLLFRVVTYADISSIGFLKPSADFLKKHKIIH